MFPIVDVICDSQLSSHHGWVLLALSATGRIVVSCKLVKSSRVQNAHLIVMDWKMQVEWVYKHQKNAKV